MVYVLTYSAIAFGDEGILAPVGGWSFPKQETFVPTAMTAVVALLGLAHTLSTPHDNEPEGYTRLGLGIMFAGFALHYTATALHIVWISIL